MFGKKSSEKLSQQEQKRHQNILNEQKEVHEKAIQEGTPGFDPTNPNLTPQELAQQMEEERSDAGYKK